MNRLSINVNDATYVESFIYPAGEAQVRLTEQAIRELATVDEIHVVASDIQSGNDIMKLALLTDAIYHEPMARGSKNVLIMPYLPYGRADRRFKQGDCFGLKVFGRIIDELAYDKVVTFDVHSAVTNKYIANLVNVSPLPLIEAALSELPKDTILLAPDKGAAERWDLKSLNKPIMYGEKQRDQVTGKLLGFDVPAIPKDSNVLIVDDICDGGRTFVGISRIINNPQKTFLYVSHGIFSNGFGELNTWFEKIYTTDSFKNGGPSRLVKVLPAGGTINAAIMATKDIYDNYKRA